MRVSSSTGRALLGIAAVSASCLAAALFAVQEGPVAAADNAPRPDPKSSPVIDDCPMFGCTPCRNLANSLDKNMPTDWNVEEGKHRGVKWTAKIGSKTYLGPAIAGGKVFIGTNNDPPRSPAMKDKDKGVLMCFRESDGKLLWQAVHDELPQEIRKEAKGEGVISDPVIEGNRLYYVNNRCEVICASTEAKPGTQEADILWRLDMIKELDVYPYQQPACSPLLVGDLVFVTTGNGVDDDRVHSPKAPSFIAVDKKTGKVKWQDNSPGDQIMLGQWSNPAYALVNGKGQVIFGGGDGWLRGFEPQTGKPIWKFDCNPKGATVKTGPRANRNYPVATPVVYDNKVYIGIGQEPTMGTGVGHLWCVDITKTGDLSPVNDNFDPQAAVNKNAGLVWHFGGASDPKAAQETGRDYQFGRTMSTCAIHDGLLYVAELAGYMYCLDAKTGRLYWDHDLKAEVWGSPYYVDGKVYIGTGDGDVHIFAHGKDKKVVGKVEMGETVYSTPVAVHGVLYIATMKNLYALVNP
jgi:outer membrane protein assembly factor BamB